MLQNTREPFEQHSCSTRFISSKCVFTSATLTFLCCSTAEYTETYFRSNNHSTFRHFPNIKTTFLHLQSREFWVADLFFILLWGMYDQSQGDLWITSPGEKNQCHSYSKALTGWNNAASAQCFGFVGLDARHYRGFRKRLEGNKMMTVAILQQSFLQILGLREAVPKRERKNPLLTVTVWLILALSEEMKRLT